MNDKPGGTPSPFSFAPQPGPGPSPNPNPISPSNFGARPAPANPTPTPPVGPTPSMTNPNMPPRPAAPAPGAPAGTPGGAPGVANINAATNPSPTKRPIEKAEPIVLQPSQPKKKTGLIIGIASGVGVAVIGIIVAVVVALNLNRVDPVTAAINKVLNNEAPTKLAVKGNIGLSAKSETSALSNSDCNINVDLTGDTSSLLNQADFNFSCGTGSDNGTASFDIKEIYPSNSDLYLQIKDFGKFLQDFTGTGTEEEVEEECDPKTDDCEAIEEVETEETTDEDVDAEATDEDVAYTGEDVDVSEIFPDSMVFQVLAAVADSIDGEWVKIPLGETEQDETAVDPEMVMGTAGSTDCTTSFLQSFRDNKNSLVDLYRKNAFILSTDENITVQKKQYPVYKVTLDQNKYTAFLDGAKNAGVFSAYESCMNGTSSSTSTEEDEEVAEDEEVIDDEEYVEDEEMVEEDEDSTSTTTKPSNSSSSGSIYTTLVDQLYQLPSKMPALYVEIDKDNNFSRIYWESNDTDMNYTFDFNFSYPATVNVSEPTDYVEIQDVFQSLFGTNYITEEDEAMLEGMEETDIDSNTETGTSGTTNNSSSSSNSNTRNSNSNSSSSTR